MQQRRFQREIIDQVVLKAEEALNSQQFPFVLVADVYPGSGKTLAMLQSGTRCTSEARLMRWLSSCPD